MHSHRAPVPRLLRLLDVLNRLVQRWALVPPCLVAVVALVAVLSAPAQAVTTIHAGDSLNVTVWNHPELSKSA